MVIKNLYEKEINEKRRKFSFLEPIANEFLNKGYKIGDDNVTDFLGGRSYRHFNQKNHPDPNILAIYAGASPKIKLDFAQKIYSTILSRPLLAVVYFRTSSPDPNKLKNASEKNWILIMEDSYASGFYDELDKGVKEIANKFGANLESYIK